MLEEVSGVCEDDSASSGVGADAGCAFFPF